MLETKQPNKCSNYILWAKSNDMPPKNFKQATKRSKTKVSPN